MWPLLRARSRARRATACASARPSGKQRPAGQRNGQWATTTPPWHDTLVVPFHVRAWPLLRTCSRARRATACSSARPSGKERPGGQHTGQWATIIPPCPAIDVPPLSPFTCAGVALVVACPFSRASGDGLAPGDGRPPVRARAAVGQWSVGNNYPAMSRPRAPFNVRKRRPLLHARSRARRATACAGARAVVRAPVGQRAAGRATSATVRATIPPSPAPEPVRCTVCVAPAARPLSRTPGDRWASGSGGRRAPCGRSAGGSDRSNNISSTKHGRQLSRAPKAHFVPLRFDPFTFTFTFTSNRGKMPTIKSSHKRSVGGRPVNRSIMRTYSPS